MNNVLNDSVLNAKKITKTTKTKKCGLKASQKKKKEAAL